MGPEATRPTETNPPPAIIGSWCPPPIALPTEVVGGKAAGLFRLPQCWTPPFLALTSVFVDEARRVGVSKALASLSGENRDLLDKLIEQMSAAGDGIISSPGLFVRSNAVEESGNTARGMYSSVVVRPILSAAVPAIEDLLRSSSMMRVILQIPIDGINGFMSNERRVTDRRDRGLIEGLESSNTSRSRLISSKSYLEQPLLAKNIRDAEQRLREVLGWLHISIQGHASVEWVWDGSRVWLVQLDEVPLQVSDPEANAYLGRDPARRENRTIRQVQGATYFVDANTGHWRKLSKATTFARAGLPTANLFIIEQQDWTLNTCKALAVNLLSSVAGPWVIRTDVSESAPISSDLLPTSSPTDDAEEIAIFMTKAAEIFRSHQLTSDQWTFIAAPLVFARASAMVYAQPGRHDIQVDALWGFPDGLMYLPHDKFLYGADGSIAMELRHKSACLLYSKGRWQTMRLGPPWDRARTLNDVEIRTIANWAQTLADDIGEPVRLMVLARIGSRRGEEACLPFHFTTGKIAPPMFGFDTSMRGVVTIRSTDDLDVAASASNIRGLAIEPNIELIRDSELLTRVASLAVDKGVPVLFQGSLLAHAYHVMSTVGAAVVPVQPTAISGSEIPYQKLVRDSIPAIIERSGGVARVRTLTVKEAVPLLKRKLVEEALEALEAASESTLTEELADLFEVIEALEQHIPGGHEAIIRAMIAKRSSRGGFDNLVFLEATAERPVDAPPGWRDRSEQPLTPFGVGITPSEDGGIKGLKVELPMIPPAPRRVLRDKSSSGSNEIVSKISYNAITISIEVTVTGKEDSSQQSLFDIDPYLNPQVET